ncbi:uncharacterized protein B0I36DRAFT_90942 [Microdochium trichocladiopsis]|uniref:Uncharacterized protein n=1 Tax=Microdochium trichocladiopsis TaxID=1682393 RepID=A0A9P8Y966_9PEZI|nr:uncharacterized protein B0I36DRAFT_90942 [Microdochium trichocladiopsis]KAH7035314.1 hypothetical protein B0I36DRAFT_90942 [Microdochium trichocladiopsis]
MLVTMSPWFAAALVAVASLSGLATAQEFTIANGQIFTPGPAVLDAPQPGTPLGGQLLEVALDVSANGRLQLPPYPADTPSRIHNITIFLQSYVTGRNFTITNATASAGNASLGDIMLSEPGSTVKHVKWIWPDCLMGNGPPATAESDRGRYNISIRQNFLLNGESHYTIFNVPISVTNSIQSIAGSSSDFGGGEGQGGRPSCDLLNNPLAPFEEAEEAFLTSTRTVRVLFAPGDAITVQQTFAVPGAGAGATAWPFRWLTAFLSLLVLSILS